MRFSEFKCFALTTLLIIAVSTRLIAEVGVGAKPLADAEIILDGSRGMLDEKWTYWEGPNSGIDGGNDQGNGITDIPGGIKLQAEGHDVRYRNIWIKELVLDKPETEFNE